MKALNLAELFLWVIILGLVAFLVLKVQAGLGFFIEPLKTIGRDTNDALNKVHAYATQKAAGSTGKISEFTAGFLSFGGFFPR